LSDLAWHSNLLKSGENRLKFVHKFEEEKFQVMPSENSYLTSTLKQFRYYKTLGEKTMDQIPDKALFWQHDQASNSIFTIVKHLSGNMISRWTDFLNSDGEKPNRNREAEFDNDVRTREELMKSWDQGWDCLFRALEPLKEQDLNRIVYIRAEPHSVTEAINRQLAHYPYHIGQIVFIGKMLCGDNWKSLSIPRGQSEQFNREKFSQPKS
jgi:hypothetical protein